MVIGLLATALVLALLALALTAREVWAFPRLRRRCLLNLQGPNGDALEGVLWARRGPWLVLKDCRLIHAGAGPTEAAAPPADGEVLIECRQVLFVQVLPS